MFLKNVYFWCGNECLHRNKSSNDENLSPSGLVGNARQVQTAQKRCNRSAMPVQHKRGISTPADTMRREIGIKMLEDHCAKLSLCCCLPFCTRRPRRFGL